MMDYQTALYHKEIGEKAKIFNGHKIQITSINIVEYLVWLLDRYAFKKCTSLIFPSWMMTKLALTEDSVLVRKIFDDWKGRGDLREERPVIFNCEINAYEAEPLQGSFILIHEVNSSSDWKWSYIDVEYCVEP